ncbi:cbb3-type cytochrome c oxidase subunit 3 [Oceanicaulis sp.]|jgi:cytochrome c oxidase cbb3-type subunit 4|uniref:cbb3-type cytochrome c oxidase subunit 3 n=1 Tax=Oceanicaulis sp. TaxID=1924941 RepID=UPI000D31EDBD
MYETLSSFAQTWGLIGFVAIFALVLVYALWPKNQDKFDDAARVPLEDDDHPDAASDTEDTHV